MTAGVAAAEEPAWVLVVDDEPVVREVLCKLLAQPDRALVAVASADEAQAAAQERSFAAALIDKNLIGASGLDLARELRRRHADLEVILMSGYASLESALEAVQIGAFDYVRKPINDYASLSLRLQNAIDKSAMRRRQRELMHDLLESELRYRTLFEATPDALLVQDVEAGKLVDANPAALALYGFPAGELLRLPVSDLVLDAAARPQRHLRKDGSEFAADATSTRFQLGGRLMETISVRDVTERMRAESKQRALELELRQSQKLDAIGRLASGIAHDFNNLLAVVLAHVDFLREGLPPGHPALGEVEGVGEAATRGAALTRQLLMFGRKKNAESGAVSWNAVVTDVLKLLHRVLGPQVQLVQQLEPALWHVAADADELAQVLLNLAINARDAMPSGGIISVESENLAIERPLAIPGGELRPGRHVVLRVRDTGSGMAPEVLARVFEPFFTTKPEGKGTGLGLATVYGIVRGAGGTLSVESVPGRGSSFAVYLPARDAPPPEPASGPPPAPLSRGRGECLLLVEDDARLRQLLRRLLEGRGFRVLEAADGHAALAAAATHRGSIALLLADVMLPDMDGFDLTVRLRERLPALPALYMTGYREVARSARDGSVALVQKPFLTQHLLEQVLLLLGRPLEERG